MESCSGQTKTRAKTWRPLRREAAETPPQRLRLQCTNHIKDTGKNSFCFEQKKKKRSNHFKTESGKRTDGKHEHHEETEPQKQECVPNVSRNPVTIHPRAAHLKVTKDGRKTQKQDRANLTPGVAIAVLTFCRCKLLHCRSLTTNVTNAAGA